MTDSNATNFSSTRRRKARLLGFVVAIALALVGSGIVGLMWFVEYGSARAHVISPLQDDQWLDHVIPNSFWVGMTRDEFASVCKFSVPMRIDEGASTTDRVVGVISDQRVRFRPNPSPALRIEVTFDGDKAVTTRWSRFEEKW
ncbi:MAG: hypothetical protein KIT19_04340 [Phycisphaeraceae bacterium]|nr:hypothetical protein [Phycisphaeraceae bacterium]